MDYFALLTAACTCPGSIRVQLLIDQACGLQLFAMEIYVCEQYHDNDCGLFGTLAEAKAHFDKCWSCDELLEYSVSHLGPHGLVVPTRIEQVESKLEYCEKLHGDKATEINGNEQRRMAALRRRP